MLFRSNNFYNKQATDEDTKFLIEAHSVKNKDYYYYSYLKYKNVVNSEGRPGAYFGMTLRFDQYCSNVIGVHQLLDILYNKYVVNNLLIEEANKIKFAVSDFKAKDEEIKKIEKESLELLRIIFNSNDFQTIKLSKDSSSKGIVLLNPYDCTKDYIKGAIEKRSKVFISNAYSTSDEQKRLQEMNRMQQSFVKNKEQEIEDLTNTINEEKKRNERLLNESENLKQEINQLQQEVNQLKQKCEENKKLKTIEQLVSDLKEPLKNIQEPLKELAEYTRTSTKKWEQPETKTNDNHIPNRFENKGRKCLIIIILVIILILGAIAIFNPFNQHP